jgi:drug/metabolite transporter (DMT)-like permease
VSLLIPPISKYRDYYKQGKFNLTWYGYLIFFILCSTLSCVHLFSGNQNLFFTLLGFGVSTISLVTLYLTRSYTSVGIFTIIIGTIVTQIMIFTQINPDRTVDILWIFIFSL